MFKQVLLAQWRVSRPTLLVFLVLGFVAPLAMVYYGANLATESAGQVAAWLAGAEKIGTFIPGIALFLGVFLGMAAWAPDQLGKHVYALSLPVSRATYVLLRFGAGATLLAIPILALGLGSMVATFAVDLPAGIHAYPVQLTLRFAFASLCTFAIFFSLSISTRRALLITLGVIGGVLLADVLVKAFGGRTSVAEVVLYALTRWPGPLNILTGRWALFDV